MDQSNTATSFEDQQVDQLLSSLQKLVLSPPGEPGASGTPGTSSASGEAGGSAEQQNPANNSATSEFDVVDPEVAAAELNHLLSRLTMRENPPDDDNCPLESSYFNAAMQIMADLHKEHASRPVDTNRQLKRPSSMTRSTWTQQSPSSSNTYPFPYDYLFRCSHCYNMVTTLYEKINPDFSSYAEELRDILPELPDPFLNEASSARMLQSNLDTERLKFNDESRYYNRRQRPPSPVPDHSFPFHQFIFNQPLPAESMKSSSPVPNLPSTSRNFNFSGDGQPSSNLPLQMRPVDNSQFGMALPIFAEKKKRFLRMKKEKNFYQQRKMKK